MKTVSQLTVQLCSLTHDDLIDGVHIQIADAIQAASTSSAVIEGRLVAAHEWIESADVSARDAERLSKSVRSDLFRALRILEGLHAK